MKVDVKVSTRVALSFLKNIKCTFSNDLDPVTTAGSSVVNQKIQKKTPVAK